MAGIHTIFRVTNSGSYKAASTTILLPDKVSYRSNDATYHDGAFFEAFHGFYKGSYGLDAGLLYDAKGFRIACSTLPGTASTTWHDRDAQGNYILLNVNPGDTVTLNTSLVNGYIKIDCLKSGVMVNSVSFYLNPTAYSTLLAGSIINREVVIAINENSAGGITKYGNCYFRNCKISRTTLTTASNTYVAMSTTNSYSTNSGLVDRVSSGDNTYANDCYDASVSLNNMDSGYVWDQASATFNNRDYPLPL